MDAIKEAKVNDYDDEMVVGFDMVCEEDRHMPLLDYVAEILKKRDEDEEYEYPVILHAGESIRRENKDLYDALLLGTKRIGHGFALAMHPHLVDIVKKEKICVECCPISNNILGYVRDLRCHPIRSLLCQGVAVSINPDDPGFFDYEGVTLDYVYAFLAWELSIADLKQLCLNSLEYAEISRKEKIKLRDFFDERWRRFLEFVRGKY